MVNWKAFEEDMGLDKVVLSELYHCFAEELQQDLINMEDAVRQRDFSTYARLIHKIKGTSASFRAEELKVLVTEVDKQCKMKQENAVYEQNPNVMKAVQDVLSVVAVLEQQGFSD